MLFHQLGDGCTKLVRPSLFLLRFPSHPNSLPRSPVGINDSRSKSGINEVHAPTPCPRSARGDTSLPYSSRNTRVFAVHERRRRRDGVIKVPAKDDILNGCDPTTPTRYSHAE